MTHHDALDFRASSILVVEDNPLFSDTLQRVVHGLGLRGAATFCSTGREALERIARRDFHVHLALVDLGLPDLSGLEVIRALNQRFPDIPIMVISVISAERSVIEAIQAGARGYILKGDSETAIAHAIEQVAQGNYPISPSLARVLFKLASPSREVAGAGDVFALTPRESETLQLIAEGNTYDEVSRHMNISLATVQTNIRNLYRKLGVHSQMQAVKKARQHGLITGG